MKDEDRALMSFLSEMVNENRLDLLERNMDLRTRYLTVVLEDIYQPHNASAVLRTCDGLGIQDVHIIENRNKYSINPDVELGTAQWLSLYKYNDEKNNTLRAITHLKREGYRIVATTPHTDDIELPDFDIGKGKTAILFGTEMKGISKLARDNADEFLRIPMFGFAESYNISVSAAMVLYNLRMKLNGSGSDWKLKEDERELIRFQWIKNSVKNANIIEKDFKKRYLN